MYFICWVSIIEMKVRYKPIDYYERVTKDLDERDQRSRKHELYLFSKENDEKCDCEYMNKRVCGEIENEILGIEKSIGIWWFWMHRLEEKGESMW